MRATDCTLKPSPGRPNTEALASIVSGAAPMSAPPGD